MKLWDITRELTGAPVYPGDAAPELRREQQMALGDMYNLTTLTMSAHNGTHLDAPLHFIPEGTAIDGVDLAACCGPCRVVAFEGLLLGDEAERLVARYPAERLLFKGDMSIDTSAAYVLADAGLRLLGVEAQSVAASTCTAAVHRHLLGSDVLLLEGLDLSAVPEGEYILFAAPLKIAGCEGAPVRALLVEQERLELEPAFTRK